MKSQRNPSAAGFTLVEMLITLTIIIVIVGLLVPALSMAKEKANRIRCSGNMRELVMAINQFAKDNETFPDKDKWLSVNSAQGVKTGQIYRYTGEPKLYICPSDTDLKNQASQGGQFQSGRQSSYAYNSWFHLRSANTLPDMSLAVVLIEPLTGQNANIAASFDPSGPPPLSDRHSGGANLAFGDQHIEYYGKDKFQHAQMTLFRETPPGSP